MSYEDECQILREKAEREQTKPRYGETKSSDRGGKGGDVGKAGEPGKSRPNIAGNICGIGQNGADGKQGKK